jgi:hypothetical protein
MQRNKLIKWIATPAILVGLLLVALFISRAKQKNARATWKNATLLQLGGLSITNKEFSQELETLKSIRGVGDYQKWTDERILLMTNDEFLVYASRHGFNNGSVDHLFLARGSNGRWYYSTYHFCNSMAMLISDDTPGSIAEFCSRYAAREFDGKSDVCLERTWPEER